MQMHSKCYANAHQKHRERGKPERLSLFFSLNSCFSYPPTVPRAYFTGKFINFATPKHFSGRHKRL